MVCKKLMSETISDILESSSIEQLNGLIKRAQEEIERKKADEIQVTRHRWIEQATTLGMSPAEILQYSGRRKGKAKYRNPANPEQTWTGRGKKPNWLRDAPNPESCRIIE